MLNEPHQAIQKIWKGRKEISVEDAMAIKPVFSGMPSHIAMILLSGLNKEVVPGYVVGFGSAVKRDKCHDMLVSAGFMERIEASQSGKKWRKGRYVTSLKGLSLLKAWAGKSKKFAEFFNAYCPKNWERKAVARQVMDTLCDGLESPTEETTISVSTSPYSIRAMNQAYGTGHSTTASLYAQAMAQQAGTTNVPPSPPPAWWNARLNP